MEGYKEYLKKYINENTTDGMITNYWDYSDEADKNALQQYLNSILYDNHKEYNELSLYEILNEEIMNDCCDYSYSLEDEFIQELINNAPTKDIKDYLQNNDYSVIIEDLYECGYSGIDYNIDQLLKNTYIMVNVLLGTDVERNYDMSSIVTAFGNDYQYPFADYAMPSVDDYDNAFTYLIHQQGHTIKEVLANHLDCCKDKTTSDFVKGAVTDIENNSSEAMSELGVYIQLNGNDILEFCNKLQEGKGCLVIDKDTNIGLFNEWSGTCGYPDNYLEKDFIVPISMIRNIQIEGAREHNGYTINEVCGLVGDFWKENAITYTDKAPELLIEDIQSSLDDIEQAYNEINKENEMEIV